MKRWFISRFAAATRVGRANNAESMRTLMCLLGGHANQIGGDRRPFISRIQFAPKEDEK